MSVFDLGVGEDVSVELSVTVCDVALGLGEGVVVKLVVGVGDADGVPETNIDRLDLMHRVKGDGWCR